MIETHLVTSDSQFGFKREHGTDLCIITGGAWRQASLNWLTCCKPEVNQQSVVILRS